MVRSRPTLVGPWLPGCATLAGWATQAPTEAPLAGMPPPRRSSRRSAHSVGRCGPLRCSAPWHGRRAHGQGRGKAVGQGRGKAVGQGRGWRWGARLARRLARRVGLQVWSGARLLAERGALSQRAGCGRVGLRLNRGGLAAKHVLDDPEHGGPVHARPRALLQGGEQVVELGGRDEHRGVAEHRRQHLALLDAERLHLELRDHTHRRQDVVVRVVLRGEG